MKSEDLSIWLFRLKDRIALIGFAIMLFSGVIRIVLQDTAPRGSILITILGYIFLAGVAVAVAGFLTAHRRGKRPVTEAPRTLYENRVEAGQASAQSTAPSVNVITSSGSAPETTYGGVAELTLNEFRKTTASNKKTEEQLFKTLNARGINASARDAGIRAWIEQYNEFISRLEKRGPGDAAAVSAIAMLKNGDVDGAEASLKASLEKNSLAGENTATAAAEDAFELAAIRELWLDYRGARDLYEQATRLEPSNSAYFNKLGVSWANLGDFKMAIGQYIRALDVDKAANGPNHKNAATYLNNVGAAWDALGDPKKAIDCFTKALEIDLDASGGKNPDAAIRYNNMGLAWNRLGDPKKALESFTKALEINIAARGPEHPEVSADYNSMGGALEAAGEPEKARECYKKALDIDLAVYGEKHPKIALRYNNIGFACNSLGDSQKAVEYFGKALDVDIAVYGAGHHDVAVDCNNIGAAWHTLGEFKKASEYYARALAIFERIYGPEHAYATNLRAKLERLAKENG